nr:hypothetical protein CFP56_03923 [Quercus suber]
MTVQCSSSFFLPRHLSPHAFDILLQIESEVLGKGTEAEKRKRGLKGLQDEARSADLTRTRYEFSKRTRRQLLSPCPDVLANRSALPAHINHHVFPSIDRLAGWGISGQTRNRRADSSLQKGTQKLRATTVWSSFSNRRKSQEARTRSGARASTQW